MLKQRLRKGISYFLMRNKSEGIVIFKASSMKLIFEDVD